MQLYSSFKCKQAFILNMDHLTNFHNACIRYITMHFGKLPSSDAFRTSKLKSQLILKMQLQNKSSICEHKDLSSSNWSQNYQVAYILQSIHLFWRLPPFNPFNLLIHETTEINQNMEIVVCFFFFIFNQKRERC